MKIDEIKDFDEYNATVQYEHADGISEYIEVTGVCMIGRYENQDSLFLLHNNRKLAGSAPKRKKNGMGKYKYSWRVTHNNNLGELDFIRWGVIKFEIIYREEKTIELSDKSIIYI